MKRTKKHISRRFRRFLRANEAVSALEYAILAGVVAVGVGGAMITFGTDIQNALTGMAGSLAFTWRGDTGARRGGARRPSRGGSRLRAPRIPPTTGRWRSCMDQPLHFTREWNMDNVLCRFLRTDEAVSALEYAVLAGVIGVGVGTALIAFGGNEASTLAQAFKQTTSDVQSILAPLLSTP